MKKIGFIGLGNMGLPMAKNIINAGIEINAFDKSTKAQEKAASLGMNVKNTVNEVVRDIDALITMLPNDKAVENVFFENNLFDQIDQYSLIIESSTISPEVSKKVSEKAIEKKISILDAPVSGGVKGAELGTLTFIVGGIKEDIEKGYPLFEIMGDKTYHAGPAGSGQIAKLCNNMLLAIHMCGTAETISLGVRNGLDPRVLSEIMKNSSGGNWSLEKYNPFPGVMDEVPASNNYLGGFLNTLMSKDLNLAEDLAKKSKSEAPMGKLAKQIYDELIKQGLGDLDFSSVQKNYMD